jgi:hypothetical protein
MTHRRLRKSGDPELAPGSNRGATAAVFAPPDSCFRACGGIGESNGGRAASASCVLRDALFDLSGRALADVGATRDSRNLRLTWPPPVPSKKSA